VVLSSGALLKVFQKVLSEKKINNLIFSEHFQTNMILQIRVPKGRIFDVIIEPKRYQKQPKWSQKGAKVRQETFKNTSCGTGSKKYRF
jgi:hypothetical protein